MFALPHLIRVLQSLDDQCLTPLKAHIDKTICFQIDNHPPLYFQIEASGIKSIDAPMHCDTTFIGPLSAFIAMIFTQKRTHTGLHIRGDVALAQALYDCWRHLDPDWEGALAKVVGDNFAHVISQGFQTTTSWARQTWTARQEDISAYLQDETHILPTQAEVDAYCADVDVLRHHVERFEAKLSILLQKMELKGR